MARTAQRNGTTHPGPSPPSGAATAERRRTKTLFSVRSHCITGIIMSSNPYAHFSGVPMSSDDIDDLLVSQGYGILSLCRDGVPYSLPISFGYDGEDVYLCFLADGSQSTKSEHIHDGATARLLVTDIRGRFEWRSVAVTGPVRQLGDDAAELDHCMETLADNGWFMRAFERSDAVESIAGWELRVDEVSGLERTEEVYD